MNLSVMQDGSEKIHYRDPAIPLYIVLGDLVSLDNLAALCHWHEDIELLMPVKGYLSYNVNGQIVRVDEGNAIFVNARQLHYGFSADGTDCVYLCICFDPELLCVNREIRSRWILPVVTDPNFTHLLLQQNNPGHIPLLNLLRETGAVPDKPLTAIGKLHEFWQLLIPLAQAEQPAHGAEVAAVKQMLEFIRTHYAERIMLTQIAAAGNVCRSRCCRIFQQYLSCTPNAYLTSFRLEKATQLLQETRLPVTEIAFHCGFNSTSYFAEVFTRQKGCSPTAYRKNLNNR